MALIRTCQKCEVFLSKFKEEICCNPYTDVTPYTQMLAAEFRKWHKAREKEIINTLFLNLYAQDVRSLRRDLCQLEPQKVLDKIKAADTAKARFPQRALLLGRLYGTLSLYLGEDLSWLIDLCERANEVENIAYEIVQEKYEIDWKKYKIEFILSDFKEAVCAKSYVDFNIYTDMLVYEYDMLETVCEKRIFKILFLNLYAQDAQSLKIAITKLNMFGETGVVPSKRMELLSGLYGALSSYIGEDFSSLMAMCDKVEPFYCG